MQLQEHDTRHQEETSVSRQYLQGLAEVVKNWDQLDPKTKKEAATYYGYTLAVAIGAPAAAAIAFFSRF